MSECWRGRVIFCRTELSWSCSSSLAVVKFQLYYVALLSKYLLCFSERESVSQASCILRMRGFHFLLVAFLCCYSLVSVALYTSSRQPEVLVRSATSPLLIGHLLSEKRFSHFVFRCDVARGNTSLLLCYVTRARRNGDEHCVVSVQCFNMFRSLNVRERSATVR